MRHFGSIDVAVTTEDRSDYTVIVSCAEANGKIYIEDVFRKKIESPDIIPEAKRIASRNNWNYICIENQGLSKPFIAEAGRSGLKVREMRAEKDKITKSLPLSARMESGDILFRKDAPWLAELERELLTFPVGKNDDMVDALGMAASTLQQRRTWEAF
jgi:predicted phage terminase large subunit-like protein